MTHSKFEIMNMVVADHLKELGKVETKVWLLMWQKCGRDLRWWASVNYIAEHTGCSRRLIVPALMSLHRRGLLRVKKGTKRRRHLFKLSCSPSGQQLTT